MKNLITQKSNYTYKRYFKVYHSIRDGLLRKTMIAIETGEERKRKIEKDTELFLYTTRRSKTVKGKSRCSLGDI